MAKIKGIVTYVDPQAAEAGARVLEAGGNVFSQRMARAQLVLMGPNGELAGGSDPRAGSAVVYARA